MEGFRKIQILIFKTQPYVAYVPRREQCIPPRPKHRQNKGYHLISTFEAYFHQENVTNRSISIDLSRPCPHVFHKENISNWRSTMICANKMDQSSVKKYCPNKNNKSFQIGLSTLKKSPIRKISLRQESLRVDRALRIGTH